VRVPSFTEEASPGRGADARDSLVGVSFGVVTLFTIAGSAGTTPLVRFAVSPIWETLAAVRTMVDERSRPYHRPWHETVRERAGDVELGLLLAVQPRNGYVPDFLTPPPATHAPRLRDQLADVRSTPPARVEHELRRCRAGAAAGRSAATLDRLVAEPAAAREQLASAIHDAWRELVAPFWPRVRSLLDDDVDRRSRTLARHGVGHALDELHPRIRVTKRGVSVADADDEVVPLDERGLLLMPSAYVWPAVVAIVDEPWQPTIVYPARGIAELWREPAPPPEALARLLGATRAMLLASLDRPLSTTALAALTELSPAGVSGHLLTLRDAGLVSARRHGHELRYRRTALAGALLRGV
jgi:DNA-binding transcriptional ArsR family regulator